MTQLSWEGFVMLRRTTENLPSRQYLKQQNET